MIFYRDTQQNVDTVSKVRQLTIPGNSRTQVHSILRRQQHPQLYQFQFTTVVCLPFLSQVSP